MCGLLLLRVALLFSIATAAVAASGVGRNHVNIWPSGATVFQIDTKMQAIPGSMHNCADDANCLSLIMTMWTSADWKSRNVSYIVVRLWSRDGDGTDTHDSMTRLATAAATAPPQLNEEWPYVFVPGGASLIGVNSMATWCRRPPYECSHDTDCLRQTVEAFRDDASCVAYVFFIPIIGHHTSP